MAGVQPLGHPVGHMPPPARAGLSFLGSTTERRPTFNIRSYQRYVAAMKLVFGVSALLLVTLVLAWPDLTGQDQGGRVQPAAPAGSHPAEAPSMEERANFSVDKARYFGVDELGRKFDITAEGAHNVDNDPRRINLKKPQARLTMEDKRELDLAASQGRLEANGKRLTLDGGVTVSHSDGYQVTTQDASVDLDKGIAEGDQPVVGTGDFGRLEAEGFRIQEKGDVVSLSGSSRLLLKPSRKEK